jgi:hypothetical protein
VKSDFLLVFDLTEPAKAVSVFVGVVGFPGTFLWFLVWTLIFEAISTIFLVCGIRLLVVLVHIYCSGFVFDWHRRRFLLKKWIL